MAMAVSTGNVPALTTATAQTGMPRPTRKELREAINASGRDYIVTFTAPSSDWYLRHFDLKGIEAHVDWVNLMSYDLHGVPGQRQPYHKAISATGTLGIYLAPLTDTRALCSSGALAWSLTGTTSYSAWASMADPLSSNLLRAGSPGSPAAASRALANPVATLTRLKFSLMPVSWRCPISYEVCGGHSWISFDDAEIFQMKIDDASNIGLHGLITWAIDLDTRNIEALRAIPKGERNGGTKASVSLVNLERFLPAEMLPPEDAETNYALIHFSSNANAGEIDPNQTGFSFVLVTGDSHSVSSLNKHEDEPEPLVFFDCPPYMLDQPKHETQTARVVFDFAFDMNLNRTRRDAGNTNARIDYSGVGGYRHAAIDPPGIRSGDLCAAESQNDSSQSAGPTGETCTEMPKRTRAKGKDTLTRKSKLPSSRTPPEIGKFKAGFSYSLSMIVSNPAYTKVNRTKLKGHMLNPSGNTWTTFQSYGKVDYMLASFNDTDGGASGHSAPYFDGKLSTRVISDFGGFNVNIRPNPEDKLGTRNVECGDNKVAMDNDNTIYNSGGSGGRECWLAGTDVDAVQHVHDVELLPVSRPCSCDVSEHYRHQSKGGDSSCYGNQVSMGEDRAWDYRSDSNVNSMMYLNNDAAKAIKNSKESFSCPTAWCAARTATRAKYAAAAPTSISTMATATFPSARAATPELTPRALGPEISRPARCQLGKSPQMTRAYLDWTNAKMARRHEH
ncbi:hypothetical protein BGZ61DRAFT_564258 [Ilyonectria robusta]|uniref:uncharacterized protein n=1 Tax=Ilyonectria robusta TaxID=1079257 RepID=UPI001E8E0C06|nr:uncharacterized protein BGZ61DRAFT_564258 [Ilyonectria robusta]KAH8661191.1 hypothetical protein BGZ61DRAFT_564258 [Ilyonectria robusta]